MKNLMRSSMENESFKPVANRFLTPPVFYTASVTTMTSYSLLGTRAPITMPFMAHSGYGAIFAYARIAAALVMQNGNRSRRARYGQRKGLTGARLTGRGSTRKTHLGRHPAQARRIPWGP